MLKVEPQWIQKDSESIKYYWTIILVKCCLLMGNVATSGPDNFPSQILKFRKKQKARFCVNTNNIKTSWFHVWHFNNLHSNPSMTKATSIISSNNGYKNTEMIFCHTYGLLAAAFARISWKHSTILYTRTPSSLCSILLGPGHHPTFSWSGLLYQWRQPRLRWCHRRTGSLFRRSCTCTSHGYTSHCHQPSSYPHSRPSTEEYGHLKGKMKQIITKNSFIEAN